MEGNDYHQELREENLKANDAEDETLSFCDLPVYGSEATERSLSSGSSTSDQDIFEFFTQGYWDSDSALKKKPESVIFGGKLIPYKQLVSGGVHQPEKNRAKKVKSKCGAGNINSLLRSGLDEKRKREAGKFEFPVKKVSILASPSKSQWYLFVFGLASYKFPPEMDLRDIRSRQSRRRSVAVSSSHGGGEKADVGRRNNRWWGLINVLGCGSGYDHRNTVVTTAFR